MSEVANFKLGSDGECNDEMFGESSLLDITSDPDSTAADDDDDMMDKSGEEPPLLQPFQVGEQTNGDPEADKLLNGNEETMKENEMNRDSSAPDLSCIELMPNSPPPKPSDDAYKICQANEDHCYGKLKT